MGPVRLTHPNVCGRQWLADALKENDPSNVLLFLVGSKKDLSVSVPLVVLPNLVRGPIPNLTLIFSQTPAQYSLMEKDALKVAQEIKAEYWAVSSLTGELGAPAFCCVHLPTSPHPYICSCIQCCRHTVSPEHPFLLPISGENVREFFFRVAALTFEANVLAELEKSGARRIGDVVRKCLLDRRWQRARGGREGMNPPIPDSSISHPFPGINSDDKNLYLTASKKKTTCCP